MRNEPQPADPALQREVARAFAAEGLGRLAPGLLFLSTGVGAVGIGCWTAASTPWGGLLVLAGPPFAVLGYAFLEVCARNLLGPCRTLDALRGHGPAIVAVTLHRAGEGGTTRISVDLADGTQEWLCAERLLGPADLPDRLLAALQPYVRPEFRCPRPAPTRWRRLLAELTGHRR